MIIQKTTAAYAFIAVLLLLGMTAISYGHSASFLLILLTIAALAAFRKNTRYLIVINVVFLASFYGYTLLRHLFHQHIDSQELAILLDRLSLGIIVLSLIVTARLCKKGISMNLGKPQWDQRIYFPYGTHGFHSIPVKLFLQLALLTNAAVFIPVIWLTVGWERAGNLFLFAILFAIVNAVLEELLWRGVLFGVLFLEVSKLYAYLVTSLAFGLHHIVLGIPFGAAISFSIGGVFFAIVADRSNSLIPAILWHMVINLFMVFSGYILSI